MVAFRPPDPRRRTPRRAGPTLLLPLLLVACEGNVSVPGTDGPIPGEASAALNPANPFGALVEVTLDVDATVHVAYGRDGVVEHATPAVSAIAGKPAEVVVLGLRADQTYTLQVMATDGSSTWGSLLPELTTDPLPAGFPLPEVERFVEDTEFTADEVICTNGWIAGEAPIYLCVDRTGEPVFQLRHPDDALLLAVRALRDGGWAAVADSDSLAAVFDAAGRRTSEYTPLWLQGRTRFEHHVIDMHELIELREGPWAGAIAVITGIVDEVHGQERVASGIVVIDPRTDEVIWDWSAHGALGDDEPIDPALDYDRAGQLGDLEDWHHGNALLHGTEEAGGQFFWLSLRAQDWIVRVDVETDAVDWRLGHGGDFTLVDDLDAAEPAPLPADEWMFQQHAPEWTWRYGALTRFLVFDNGAVRPDTDAEYSRVVEYAIDEQTMLAAPVFEYGSPVEGATDWFYSEGVGDADRLPGGDAVLFVGGWCEPRFVTEISYPEGRLRWRASWTAEQAAELYRAHTAPSLYDTGWTAADGF